MDQKHFRLGPPCLDWWLDCWCHYGTWEAIHAVFMVLTHWLFCHVFHSTVTVNHISLFSPYWVTTSAHFILSPKSAVLTRFVFSTCSNVCKLLCESTVETCPPLFADVKIAGLSPCLPPPTLCKNIPKGQRALEPLFYVSRISVRRGGGCRQLRVSTMYVSVTC